MSKLNTKLMTVRNYAEKKKVVKDTVYKWVKKGKVKFVIIDGVIFIEDNE